MVCGKDGNPDCRGRKCDPHQCGVERRQREIVGPAQRFALPQRTTRRQRLPRRHDAEDGDKSGESYRCLVVQEEEVQYERSRCLAGDGIVRLLAALHAVGQEHLAEVDKLASLYFESKDSMEPVPAKELMQRATDMIEAGVPHRHATAVADALRKSCRFAQADCRAPAFRAHPSILDRHPIFAALID